MPEDNNRKLIPQGQALPPSRDIKGVWSNLLKHPVVKVGSVVLSFGFAAFSFQNFLQMRGYESLLGSQFFLALCAISVIVPIWIWARSSATPKVWPPITGTVLIIVVAVVLDRIMRLPISVGTSSSSLPSPSTQSLSSADCKAKYLGCHDVSELPFMLPPGSTIDLGKGTTTPQQQKC